MYFLVVGFQGTINGIVVIEVLGFFP